MKNKKTLILVVMTLLLTSILSGCNFSNDSQKTTTDDNSKGVVAAEPKVLNWILENDIADLNQSKATTGIAFRILNNVMEGLYRQDEKHEAQPAAAQGVVISEDKLTYTFTLRDNLQWSNGDPVTAHDYKYAWMLAMNPETASTYASIIGDYVKGGKAYTTGKANADTVGIEVKDDKTLVVHLEQPTPFFLKLTAFVTYFPLNQKFVESVGSKFALTKETMLYNGPYVLTSYDQAKGVVLEKNPKYWDKDQVKIDKVNLNVIKEQSTALNLYEAGEIDRVDLTSNEVKKFRGTPDFGERTTFTSNFIQFNMKKPEIANINIRRALQTSYDAKILTDVVLNNGSQPATGLVAPNVTGINGGKSFREIQGDVVKPDINKAKELWAKGVAELGSAPKLELLISDSSVMKDVGTFLQSEFKKNLGIDVALITKPSSGRLQSMRENAYQMAINSWGPDFDDATSYLNQWRAPVRPARGNYDAPKYFDLLAKAETETDEQKRIELLAEAERVMLDEDVIIAPLYYSGQVYLVKPYVKNPVIHSYGASLELKYFDIQK